MTVKDALLEMHITPNLHGYQYLQSAVKLAQADQTILYRVTKDLYPAVAAQHNTKAARVERCLRSAIERAYDLTDTGTMLSILGVEGSITSGKLTNGAFIGVLAERVED